MANEAFQFETFEGNTRVLTFKLRRYLDKHPWNVSAAGQIQLECTSPAGVNIAPILADSGDPGADWTNGIVVVPIDVGNVTGMIGTWAACLTIFIGGEQVTADSGSIEVYDRPGYVLP